MLVTWCLVSKLLGVYTAAVFAVLFGLPACTASSISAACASVLPELQGVSCAASWFQQAERGTGTDGQGFVFLPPWTGGTAKS